MEHKLKNTNKDTSFRHAFIFISALRNDYKLTFSEIAEHLNKKNYRTKNGRKFNADTVSKTWGIGKRLFPIEYNNLKRNSIKLSRDELTRQVIQKPGSKAKSNNNPPKNMFYLAALRIAAEELNTKLQLNPEIQSNLSKYKLIKELIRVIRAYDIYPAEYTDQTLIVLGNLLFHPVFRK